MKKIVFTWFIFLIFNIANASYLQVRCSKETFEINQVLKDVRVMMYEQYIDNEKKYVLSITTKPGNSPSYRSNPIPNDPVFFKDYLMIEKYDRNSSIIKTHNQVDGYIIEADGNIYGERGGETCISYLTLKLIPVGNPSLKIQKTFHCTGSCDD